MSPYLRIFRSMDPRDPRRRGSAGFGRDEARVVGAVGSWVSPTGWVTQTSGFPIDVYIYIYIPIDDIACIHSLLYKCMNVYIIYIICIFVMV